MINGYHVSRDIKSYLQAGKKYNLKPTDMVAEVCPSINERLKNIVEYRSRFNSRGRYLQWQFDYRVDENAIHTPDKNDKLDDPLYFLHAQSMIGEHYLRLISKRASQLTGSKCVAFLCFPDSPSSRIEVDNSVRLNKERTQIREIALSNKGSENLPQLLIEKIVDLWAEPGFPEADA